MHELSLEHTLLLVSRSAILYLLALAVIRVLGKRGLGQLAPIDVVVIIAIGAAVAIPLADESVHMVHGIVPTIAVVVFHIGLSWMSMRWQWLERLTQGTNTLLIDRGEVIERNLIRERLTLSDLHSLLREQEVDAVEQVEKGWLEPNGRFALIKARNQVLDASDLEAIRRIIREEIVEERKQRS